MAQRFKTDMNKLRADASAFDTGGGGANFLKMPDGKHLIRILPTWKENGLFYQKVGFHRPPGRDVSKKVICPEYTFGKKGTCPICKAKQRVYKQLGKDAAKDYAYQKRAYINVLDMKAADGQVKVFEAPATVMNPILNFMSEEESDQLVDLNKGYNIMIVRKKDGGFTKYEVMIKPGEFDLEAKGYDVDDILENLTALDKFVSMPEADDFQEILDALNEKAFGEGDGDNGEEQEDDDPPPRKLKSQKVAAEPADDDEDDPSPKAMKKKAAPVEEEEEDDEPAPPPKKKKPAPEPVEDDEPEEEEEDDEPAPPPKKTLAGKKKPQPVVDEEEEDDEPAPPKKKSKPAPVADDDDDLDGIEDFDDTGFDADEPIPF